jgi:hypothetical protein
VSTTDPDGLMSRDCDPDAGTGYWIEPGTLDRYPTSYRAYRIKRESQDRTPARHRRMAPDVDHLLWRREGTNASDVEVVLAFRPGAPPRIQRLVAEVLGSIRRGRSASDAIRRAARRFGLRHGRARAFITEGITFERHPRHETPMSHPRRRDEARRAI